MAEVCKKTRLTKVVTKTNKRSSEYRAEKIASFTNKNVYEKNGRKHVHLKVTGVN